MSAQPAFMRPQQAADYLGITRRHLYNIAERDPEFPARLYFLPAA